MCEHSSGGCAAFPTQAPPAIAKREVEQTGATTGPEVGCKQDPQSQPESRCLSLEALSSVQALSRVRLLAKPWTAACQTSPSITNSQSLLKLRSIQSVMLSNHLILCHPLLLQPSIFPSIRVFSNVLHIGWPKYWSFSFSISPSNEYSGPSSEYSVLISVRMDWLDLLAEQGTLKSLLQHHSSNH